MPEIQAFRGLRYDLGHVGCLSDVVAPPYDVISPDLQDELYRRHPANVIRLILNREEVGDDEHENRYSRAARLLRNWRSEGVLQLEPDAALYVYHQEFCYGDQRLLRRGFMGRVRLERFGEGRIYPHEETHAGPKADRLKLTNACRANLSQIFGLYPDEGNAAQQILEEAVAGQAPLEATDHLGVIHRLWPLSDVRVIGEVAAIMDPKPMYVADGHHRYETACNYRDQLAAAGPLPPSHPANFVLTMFVSMDDQGLIVMPTHRLFRKLPSLSSAELIARLGDYFAAEVKGRGPELARSLWDEIESEQDQGTLGLFAPADQTWMVARIAEAGKERMAELATEHSRDWQSLGVAILHRLVIETLLSPGQPTSAKYVHLVDEVVDSLAHGDPEGGTFSLAALVMPATLNHIRAISEHGERMPAKSTYFYPKLLSGLVFHPLD